MITTFKFGLLTPTINADLVRDQMHKGHVYQNKLIEIERWRRNEIRSIESKAGNIPQLELDFSVADAKVEELKKKSKKANATARAKVVTTEEAKKELAEAKKALSAAKSALLTARRLLREDPDIIEKKKVIDAEEKRKQSELRKSDLAPWYGTYMLVEDAHQKTRKMPFYDGVKPNDPGFHRYCGEGRIGIQQYQESNPAPRVYAASSFDGTSKKLQIIPIPASPLKANGAPRKVGKKDLRMLRLRIGTDKVDGKKQPVWAEFPMVYHRCIPANAIIQVVQVHCRKIGSREYWTASITFEDNKETPINTNTESIGIDLGWRNITDSDGKTIAIRIAYGIGSDGQKWGIQLPAHVIDILEKAKSVESIRDKNFDHIISELSTWLKTAINVPEWLIEECETLDKWKSQNRLIRLINRWRGNRFAGDEAIFGTAGTWDKATKTPTSGTGLEGWRYHDHHLWNWASSQRNRAIGYRNEEYRKIAAQLVRQYGTIGFEDLQLNHLAKSKIGSTSRQLTAPSKFRDACKNACRSNSKQYKEVDPKRTSKECNHCNHINDIGGKLEYFCMGCGTELDRDENAGRNILDRVVASCERPSDAQNAATARNDENISEVA
jgi:hypothetical protein